jgi:uridine kinase
MDIKQVTLRPTIEVQLPDGRVLSGPRGTTAEQFLKTLPDWKQLAVLGCIINGKLSELTTKIEMDATLKPLTMQDTDGVRIYRRSLTFLLGAAFEDLYKNCQLAVDHSIDTGGFFCEVVGREALNADELEQLEKHMRDLVNKDIPFERSEVPVETAIKCFESRGYVDKVRLMKYRQKEHLVLYQLGEHKDYHHGYMVPSTGYLKWFKLSLYGEGFVLQFPRRHQPETILPLPKTLKLLDTFQQYGDWLETLGIESVGALNDSIKAKRIREVILVSEALHEQKIAEIASQIANKANHKRIILIAGPSSSGKTTFSKRLTIQLLAHGLSPFALEMDSYFLDREDTPLDENGEYDFESIRAVNTGRLSKDLKKLLAGEEVQLPHFNFVKGKSEDGDVVRLSKDQLIILEGIHGLNPLLLPEIAPDQAIRIYISALTQLNLDRHNRISTTDTRLIRRIVRDARERGYSATDTIQRWESVRRGEKRHIFPYQENADEMFNSALVYEMAALKPYAEPLLRQVPYGTMEHVEAKRLLALLEWFLPVDSNLLPDNSLLREFIGNSILQDFKVWGSSELY